MDALSVVLKLACSFVFVHSSRPPSYDLHPKLLCNVPNENRTAPYTRGKGNWPITPSMFAARSHDRLYTPITEYNSPRHIVTVRKTHQQQCRSTAGRTHISGAVSEKEKQLGQRRTRSEERSGAYLQARTGNMYVRYFLVHVYFQSLPDVVPPDPQTALCKYYSAVRCLSALLIMVIRDPRFFVLISRSSKATFTTFWIMDITVPSTQKILIPLIVPSQFALSLSPTPHQTSATVASTPTKKAA